MATPIDFDGNLYGEPISDAETMESPIERHWWGGRKNVTRNVFESNEEPTDVPLRLGTSGPIIGTAKVVNGHLTGEVTITDEEVKRQLTPPTYSLSLPSDRYRVKKED